MTPRSSSGGGWLVYLLACRGGSLYAGITCDLAQRLRAHRSGRGAAYTRAHRPVRLVYQEAAPDRGAALRREAEIRRWPRQWKLALIAITSGRNGNMIRGTPGSSVRGQTHEEIV